MLVSTRPADAVEAPSRLQLAIREWQRQLIAMAEAGSHAASDFLEDAVDAAADDLSSALKIVLRQVCEKTGWLLGQAWVPDKDEAVLVCDSDWFCGEDDLQEFRVASEAMQFKPGVGLPGRVWGSKQPAWVENVTNDPNFPRSAAARATGLKTGVGIPILSGDKVIAVLEFFMRESRDQNERLLNVIASVAGFGSAR